MTDYWWLDEPDRLNGRDLPGFYDDWEVERLTSYLRTGPITPIAKAVVIQLNQRGYACTREERPDSGQQFEYYISEEI